MCRAVQWISTLVLFLVPMWYLMRNPFLGHAAGRAFVRKVASEVSSLCKILLPSARAICGTAPPVMDFLDMAYAAFTTPYAV